ncbi:MAG: VTT domain-containing protein [Arenicellales bacterium]
MKSKLIRIGLFLVLATGIALAIIYRDQFNAEMLENWVKEAGAAGPIIYILIYAVGTVFFLPGSVLTLTGGALFGPVMGTFVNLTGATLGALGSFLIARYLAHDWVANKTGGRIKTLMDGVENEGWRFVAFVRLVPLFPFNLLNYALGLTRIKLFHYVIATYIFMLPGAIAYTYLGYAGREAIGGGEGLIQKGMLALGLLALVAFLPRLIGQLRKKPMISTMDLKRMLDAGDDVHVVDVRTAEDFTGEKGYIAQAINIPLEEMRERLSELDEDLEKTADLKK